MSITEDEILAEMQRIQDDKRISAIRAEANRRIQAAAAAQLLAERSERMAAFLADKQEKEALAAAAAAANAQAEAAERAAAEVERKRLWQVAMEAQRAASFPSWIEGGCWFSKDRYPLTYPTGWNQADLEVAFWDYVSKNGGFPTCPTCGKKPFVNKRNTFASSTSYGSITSVAYTEGLWNHYTRSDLGAVGTILESINCCEHLWELKTKKRYIATCALADASIFGSSVGFRVQEKFSPWGRGEEFGYQADEVYVPSAGCSRPSYYDKKARPQYVLYNPEDPDGSKAKAVAEKAAKDSKIAELRAQLAALEGSLPQEIPCEEAQSVAAEKPAEGATGIVVEANPVVALQDSDTDPRYPTYKQLCDIALANGGKKTVICSCGRTTIWTHEAAYPIRCGRAGPSCGKARLI